MTTAGAAARRDGGVPSGVAEPLEGGSRSLLLLDDGCDLVPHPCVVRLRAAALAPPVMEGRLGPPRRRTTSSTG